MTVDQVKRVTVEEARMAVEVAVAHLLPHTHTTTPGYPEANARFERRLDDLVTAVREDERERIARLIADADDYAAILDAEIDDPPGARDALDKLRALVEELQP